VSGPGLGRRRLRSLRHRDVVASSTNALMFSLALGVASLTLPLLALDAGYGVAQIGLLVSLSAVVQIVVRASSGRILRRIEDRTLLAVAGSAQVLCFLVALSFQDLWGLAFAWTVQGFARACFWTASQTHVMRGPGTSIGAMAVLNSFGSIGALIGPVVAGLLAESSIEAALTVGAVAGGITLLPVAALDRLPTFVRPDKRSERSVWRRPGVDAACWSGVTAGTWRALMDSVVPAALQGARQSTSTTGALMSVANGTAVLGALVIGRLRPSWVAPVFVTAMLMATAGIGAFGFAAGSVPVAAVLLAAAGLGAGALQTLGPALAATSVEEHERADAVAAYGTMRTTAMFGAPLAVAGMVTLIPVAPALLVVGAVLSVPTVTVRSLRAAARSPG
jgi:MFS family permease